MAVHTANSFKRQTSRSVKSGPARTWTKTSLTWCLLTNVTYSKNAIIDSVVEKQGEQPRGKPRYTNAYLNVSLSIHVRITTC